MHFIQHSLYTMHAYLVHVSIQLFNTCFLCILHHTLHASCIARLMKCTHHALQATCIARMMHASIMHPMHNALDAPGTRHIMQVLHRHTIVYTFFKLIADRQTDQPTDIATYRAAIAAKKTVLSKHFLQITADYLI